MSKVTKLSQAIEIVKAAADKKQALADIQNALGVSKSNAFVYYTKATKGVAKPVVEKAAKAVVEKTDAKREKKLSDIDRFILSVKAQAENKPIPSPFAGLGV